MHTMYGLYWSFYNLSWCLKPSFIPALMIAPLGACLLQRVFLEKYTPPTTEILSAISTSYLQGMKCGSQMVQGVWHISIFASLKVNLVDMSCLTRRLDASALILPVQIFCWRQVTAEYSSELNNLCIVQHSSTIAMTEFGTHGSWNLWCLIFQMIPLLHLQRLHQKWLRPRQSSSARRSCPSS